ncbi:hypothetical protein HC241_09320, partial [Streptococcus suis]|nr:hypothetical protein [Streptococcus suis]
SSLFIIGHMGLFFYTQKGSIISTVVLPTTEIIEPKETLLHCARVFSLIYVSFHLVGSKSLQAYH